MTTPVVSLKGLHKAFRGHLGIGRTVAVEHVDLEVGAGEVVGLLGPNGAGKTTTLKMMLGLVRPDAGEIRLFGAPPGDPAASARIGYLPENPYFYDYLTAEEFLDFYGRLQGLSGAGRRERIAATIARVGLQGRERTALRKFSKGMTQRLGLAQAIQHEPDLVILDEPMSGLDPIGRHEVRDLILSLRDAGTTVFFSSHILQDAEMICDRVAILERGSVRSVGPLAELVSSRVLWFEVAVSGVAAHDVDGDVLAEGDDGVLVRIADAGGLARLIGEVERRGGSVDSIWPRRETLEDLFLREVGRPAAPEPRS